MPSNDTNTTPPAHVGSTAELGFEKCPDCGAAASCTLGPDYRFNPPCSRPQMWTVCCGGECFDLSMSWTAFTRERAREMWNKGVQEKQSPNTSSTTPPVA
jgi:hypothetical protein